MHALNECYERDQQLSDQLYDTHAKKFSRLLKQNKIPFDRVHNTFKKPTHAHVSGNAEKQFPFIKKLSNVMFTNEELNILNKGVNFNFRPRPNNLENNVVALQSMLQSFAFPTPLKCTLAEEITHDLNMYKQKISQNMNSQSGTVLHDNHEVQNLLKKLKLENLLVMKADKGNHTVILHRNEYIDKCQSNLESTSFLRTDMYTTKLLRRCQTELKECLKSIRCVFPKDFKVNSLIIKNPQLAIMYGLPKIHKTNIPMRPIVPAINTVPFKLAQYLNRFLVGLNRTNSHILQDSKHFISQLNLWKSKNPTSFRMCSFDVISLYPSVQLEELYPIISKLLANNNYDSNFTCEILRLVRLVNQTFPRSITKSSNKLMGWQWDPLLHHSWPTYLWRILNKNC